MELSPAPGGLWWVPVMVEASEVPKCDSMAHSFQVACPPSSGSSPVHFWGNLGGGHPGPGWAPLPPGPSSICHKLGRMRGDLL